MPPNIVRFGVILDGECWSEAYGYANETEAVPDGGEIPVMRYTDSRKE
jgi:hypothetical protein